jgi:glutamate-1-semialdehyde 2,1-aminomutase
VSEGGSTGSESEDLGRRSAELLAYGGRHRVLLRPLYEDERGAFPQFAAAADGYRVTDAAGRRLVDWTSSGGPMLLGYRNPEVEQAIAGQLEAGPMLPLTHELELEVAELLVETIPCAEMVAFGKNGSDAVTAAVRIARAVTGREVILHYGFHGFHDWYVARYQNAKGVPRVLELFIRTFPYNELRIVEELFERFKGRVAAVVMEPFDNFLPQPGYLEGVKELAHANDALLVFDEMITGFRVAPGGAQELCGVVPDLACFGKAIANGMPLSAVVGKSEYMRELPNTAYGMTFRGETLSLAAARATLRFLKREPVSEHVAAIGTQVRDGFAKACAERGVRAELIGHPARMSFAFHPDGGIAPGAFNTFFLRECARHGVLTNGVILPMYAHDAESVELTLEAFGRALDPIAAALEPARAAVEQALRAGFERGSVTWSPGEAPGGLLEYSHVGDGTLELVGWMLSDAGALDAVALVGPDGERYGAERFGRPDLAQAFPDVAGADAGGFKATVPARRFAAKDGHRFELMGMKDGSVVFSIPIEHRAHAGSSALPAVTWTGEALVFD